MPAGNASLSHVLARALLCLALFAAMLGQNFGHLAEEAAAKNTIRLMPASGGAHGSDHTAPGGTPVDCGDYGCHFLALLRAAPGIYPARDALAAVVQDSGGGAHLPRPDKPPRP
jgi:hypothetical protein